MLPLLLPILLLGASAEVTKEKGKPNGRQFSFYINPAIPTGAIPTSAIPTGQQIPSGAGYPTGLQYDPYLNHQIQYPGYYGIPDNQGLPVQPQVLYYPGNPGQPFLLNPGGAPPPGNFLYPQIPQQQPQPGFDPSIFRQQPQYPQYPQYPQKPVFVSGYPKPAHIPPIEKDAEEIPTDPKPQRGQRPQGKPEKLELEEEADQKPGRKQHPLQLRPGQRFFVLNGQPLFSNYPLNAFQEAPTAPERYQYNPFYTQPYRVSYKTNQQQQQNEVLRNAIIPKPQEDDEGKRGILLRDALPLKLQNQLFGKDFGAVLLKHQLQQQQQQQQQQQDLPEEGLRLNHAIEEPLPIYEGNVNPGISFDFYRYNDNNDDGDNDAVIIDAKFGTKQDDTESEAIESNAGKVEESSIAQAQPGAIALAGPGGVAAAGPKGTALAGEGGLAISSPQATAVAGPSKEDREEKKTTTKPAKKQAKP